jgi:predicted acylesterase/phospholipase RssA
MHLFALALVVAAPPAALNRLALTISGGVSLGNYEAGLTWTIAQYLRRTSRDLELAAVTGSSAGSVNALLAAAQWCEDGSETRDDHPDSNLFHDAWTPVGIEELLPDATSAYSPDDAVMSAAPLERALQRIRAQLFEREGRRYRPGCSVPLGFTVTRDVPEEREVSGLRARTQRFVVPLRFEVDAAGTARVVRLALPPDRDSASVQLLLAEPGPPGSGVGALQVSEAVLASGAFPFAFRSRKLCHCALQCPDEQTVRDGSCEGPDAAHPIAGLSCTPPQRICRHSYIDGGIFDSAPIGLAIDLAEMSGGRPNPFVPALYFVVDPDYRRYAPEEPTRAGPGMAGPVKLIANLIGTARESELARAIRAERWQRTTQSTLAEAAALQAEVTAIQEQMRRVAGGVAEERTAMQHELLRSRRGRLSRFLLRCLGEMRAIASLPGLGHCAERLRTGTAGVGEEEAQRLAPDEVAELAAGAAAVFTSNDKRRERALEELGEASTPMERRLRLLVLVRDASTIAQASFGFLVGELPGLASSQLSEKELLAVRRDLLASARESKKLVDATAAMLRAFVATVLLEEGLGAMTAAAAQARSALLAGLDPAMQGAPLRASAGESERVAALVALAPRVLSMAAKATSIAAAADQLSSGAAAERQLILSRRFSPLGGGQLFNFSGFLDRGLRELDFYLGVYDAAMQIAASVCQRQGPYAAGRPAPVFRSDAPLELDTAAEGTQHCVGESLRAVSQSLQLETSPRASLVLARLARLEVAAQVGGRAEAERILRHASWSWLREPALPERDPVARGLRAMTSFAAPCRATDDESLCLAEPTFDEFLDALQAQNYPAHGAAMQQALDDRSQWSTLLLGRIVDRSAIVELRGAERMQLNPSDLFLLGTGLGELWSRRARSLSGGARLELDPSSIPEEPLPGRSRAFRILAHLVPYRVSLDVAKGGIGLAWLEPEARLTQRLSIQSIADLLDVTGSGHVATTLGLLPTLRLGDVALSAGVRWSFPWNGDSVQQPGVLGRLALLQERFALAGGIRSTAAGKREAFVALSVSDLNGIAYWLTPWGGKQK